MHVRFWGVRGSYPVPGTTTNRYGGNTSCVQVCPDDGAVIIVDAGTGIRRLGREVLGAGKQHSHLLISHTHWDHIQGLPFYAPLYSPDSQVTIYARQRDVHLKTLFCSQTQDPYFPVSIDDVAATVSYRELIEGTAFRIGSARVQCARLNHPYIAIGYRVEADGAVVAYISDTAPFDRMLLGYEFIGERPDPGRPIDEADAAALAAMREGVVALCAGADLVVYDTMFEMSEYLACPHWGHSAPEHAVELAADAGAACLALYHHNPLRTDEQQDAILTATRERARSQPKSRGLEIIAAAEGMRVALDSGCAQVMP